ncbi:MAG: pyridoxamine 5'-phosphate oxidase family protein [Helicobacteraceae bacterium]|jgi:general stress protein 26|nr:pyridoxamine 5'-phosphate oxidase family protein [Helicobacteraceae bacterium]
MQIKLEQLAEFIDKQSTAFVGTLDDLGYPNIKAMLSPIKREGLKTFWFHTNAPSLKVRQARANPKTCLYFCDTAQFRGLMLRGKTEVVNDDAIKTGLWREAFTMYYKGGALGGDFILLKFTAETGRFYFGFDSDDFVVE